MEDLGGMEDPGGIWTLEGCLWELGRTSFRTLEKGLCAQKSQHLA